MEKEPNFWDCIHGIFAGDCLCKLRGGDNSCPLERGGKCSDYETDDKTRAY